MAKFLDESGLRILWEQIKKEHETHQADLVEILSNYATAKDLEDAISELSEDLADAVRFAGVVENLDEIENPQNGDIVLQGTSEYIYVEEDLSAEYIEELEQQIADATDEMQVAIDALDPESFESEEALAAEEQRITEEYQSRIEELQQAIQEELENPREPAGEWHLIGDEGVYATKAEVESMKIDALTEEEIKAICWIGEPD